MYGCACVHVCMCASMRACKCEEEPRGREDIGLDARAFRCMLSCICLGSASERRGLWSNDFKVLAALRPFSARAGSSLLHARPCRPSTGSMDERLERGLRVLCPMRASMVESKEPGQRSPRDGG